MGSIKDINIKNRTYYFYDDMVSLKKRGNKYLYFAFTDGNSEVLKNMQKLEWN